MAVQATSEEKQKRKEAFGFRLTKKQLEAGKEFFESLSQKRVEKTKKRIAAPPKKKTSNLFGLTDKEVRAAIKKIPTTKELERRLNVIHPVIFRGTQREKGLKGKGTPAGPTPESEDQIRKAQAEAELAESKADQGHLATEIAAQKTETATKIADTARVKLGQAEEEATQVAKQGGFVGPTLEQSGSPALFADDPVVGTPEESLQGLEGNIADFAEFPEFGEEVDPSGLQPTEFAAALAKRNALLGFTRPPEEQDKINVLAKLRADRLLGQVGSQAASQRARFERSLTGGAPLTGAQLARIDLEAVSQINLRAKGGFLGIGKEDQKDRALLSLQLSGRGIGIIAASDSQRQRLARSLKNSLNRISPEDQVSQGLGRTDALNRLAAIGAGVANEAMTGLFETDVFSDAAFLSTHYQGILRQEDDALGLVEVDNPFGSVEKAQIEETANRAKQDAIDSIAAAMVEQNEFTEVEAKTKGAEISATVNGIFLNKETGILRNMKDSVGKNARSEMFLVGAVRMQQDALEYSRKLQEALIKFARVRTTFLKRKEKAQEIEFSKLSPRAAAIQRRIRTRVKTRFSRALKGK